MRPPYRVSGLVKHYNIRSVTAHVHEANDEGLHWYAARGFKVEDGVVEGYYRRLNPTGARIVRLELDWEDDDYIQTKEEGRNESTTSSSAQQEVDAGEKERDDGDDDWEKVEAEDGDDQEDHGIENFGDSHILDPEELPNRKRKADSELHA